jgi:thiamine transport system substrate-binding protein
VPATVAPALPAAASEPTTVTLMTHDSFAVSKSVLRAFTRATGVKVKILRAGDAGSALNQAILTKGRPLADVFFGVDNTLMSRALDAGIFEAYTPAGIETVPADLRLDPSNRLVPVDRGDVCLNYDKKWFKRRGVAAPTSLDDLVSPTYRNLLVVENPATSSPGLAFMLATIAKYGEGGWRDYWAKLRTNGVEVVAGWEEAYNGSFTQGGGGGERPIVVSYASSPPAAVYYSDPQPKTSPIGVVLASCFHQVEMAGVLQGTEHRNEARQLVDFLLSEKFQADVPLQMFVFPARTGTPLPELFTEFAEVPTQPLDVPANDIERNRERWIQQWTDTVLR